MIDVTTVKLPTHFEQAEPLENDSRFQKVRIFIAHTGVNLNNSIFSKEVLTDMIPSLANIPILGYIAENDSGEDDFRGHEKKLSVKDNKLNVSFNTHAYGFIPEDNNAHFETTGGKEWLVADGYLWTRFVDAMELFDDDGYKGQSMEITNGDGYTDDRGRVVFTQATFTGLCILGDDVAPAMSGSTISMVFSKTDFKEAFEEMLAEFTAEKGEYALATKKKQNDKDEPVVDEKKPTTGTKPQSPEKVPTSSAGSTGSQSAASGKGTPASSASSDKSAEPASSASSAPSSASAEPANSSASGATTDDEHSETMSADDDKKDKESKEDDGQNQGNESEEPESMPQDEPDEEKKKSEQESCGGGKSKKKAQFELDLSEREYAFIDACESKYFNNEMTGVRPVEVYEAYGIVLVTDWNTHKSNYYRIDYSVDDNDNIVLGDKTEVFSTYLTADEVKKVESDRTKLADLQSQIEELTKYKNGVEMSKKQKALDGAKERLTGEQVESIKANFEKMSVEEVEKEIAYAVYKSNSEFSVARQGVQAVKLNGGKDDFGYGTANHLFH